MKSLLSQNVYLTMSDLSKTLILHPDIVIMKHDERNGVVTLDLKLHNNTIQIISDKSKFEKLNEDPTLKQDASLQSFLCKLEQKNLFSGKCI